MTKTSNAADILGKYYPHIKELKHRTIIVMGVWLLATLLALTFASTMFNWLVTPLRLAAGNNQRMIYTGMTEVFVTYIELAAIVGVIAVLPLLIWQIYRYAAPGLHNYERNYIGHLLLARHYYLSLAVAFAIRSYCH